MSAAFLLNSLEAGVQWLMQRPQSASVTRLLVEWRRGDQESLNELLPLVHCELRRIARRFMRMESPSHTLQTTALVNEAYADHDAKRGAATASVACHSMRS